MPMLEMEQEGGHSCTTMDAPTEPKTTTRRRRVSFAPYASQIRLPPSEDNHLPSESIWYSKEEMHKQAREDVNAMIADSKSEKSNASRVCGRGLEMHMPGQLALRQRRRKGFTKALLQKQELLTTLCGDNKGEVADRLRKFSELRSKQSREEAQALGVQDGIDAHPGDLPSKEASIRPKPQVLTIRNPTMIRAI